MRSAPAHSQRRFIQPHTLHDVLGEGLRADHPALVNNRTIFPKSVVWADESPRVLISGMNSRKIGKVVTKGRWRGMPIFTLTLEERATCPRSCAEWRTCYGNQMPFARRHQPGPELEYLLEEELAQKQEEHGRGFVVRLHILGDFYGPIYALKWRRWLAIFPALRIFGYTAHPPDSAIGRILASINKPGRVAIRFSGQDIPMGAITIAKGAKPERAIICPAQTGKTECCATCALCWATDKTIAFIRHGRF